MTINWLQRTWIIHVIIYGWSLGISSLLSPFSIVSTCSVSFIFFLHLLGCVLCPTAYASSGDVYSPIVFIRSSLPSWRMWIWRNETLKQLFLPIHCSFVDRTCGMAESVMYYLQIEVIYHSFRGNTKITSSKIPSHSAISSSSGKILLHSVCVKYLSFLFS